MLEDVLTIELALVIAGEFALILVLTALILVAASAVSRDASQ